MHCLLQVRHYTDEEMVRQQAEGLSPLTCGGMILGSSVDGSKYSFWERMQEAPFVVTKNLGVSMYFGELSFFTGAGLLAPFFTGYMCYRFSSLHVPFFYRFRSLQVPLCICDVHYRSVLYTFRLLQVPIFTGSIMYTVRPVIIEFLEY